MNQRTTRLGFPIALGALLALAGCTREGNTTPDAAIEPTDAAVAQDGGDAGGPVETCVAPGSTLGNECETAEDCNDGCFCTGTEVCTEGVCAAGSAVCGEDALDCTTVSCNETTDRCAVATDNTVCQNGDACDGTEVCHPTRGCIAAEAPTCNDESACTIDSCDSATGCVYTPRDLDGDGYVSSSCDGLDCDDDPRYGTAVYPGATEVCDNRRDDDCDGRRDYADESCLPTNDTCGVATVLTLGPTGGTFSGGTSSLAHDYSLGCGSSSGPDAVFRFTLTEAHDVRITTTAGDSTLALRQFDQCSSGPDLKCNAAAAPSILRRSLPAGEYAIIVSTSSGGSFDLSVRLSDPTVAPPVDVCDSGTLLVPVGTTTYSGIFEEASDDYSLACNSASMPDVVYAFEVAEGESKDVTITGSTSGAAWGSTAYVGLTTNCDSDAAYLTCTQEGSPTTVRRRGVGPGRYYIVLEAGSAEDTAYSLTVTIADAVPPPEGDSCVDPIEVTPTAIPGTASGSVAASATERDIGLSCGSTGSSYRDSVFSFTLTSTQDVSYTITHSGSTLGAALQTTCGSSAAQIRCVQEYDSSLTQSFRSLPPGTYYIVVQSDATSGNVTADVTVSAPTPIPANDRCPGIVVNSGDSRHDTLIDFDSDADLSCGSGGVSPDAFYQFTLTSRRRVLAVATSDSSSATMYVSITSTCGSSTSISCVSGSPSTTATATLDPGTYYIAVETPWWSTPTDFTLDFVTLAP